MTYSLDEYVKLFDTKMCEGDDPDDSTLYKTYIIYKVEIKSEKDGKWYWICPANFRKLNEAEDYINLFLKGKETKITTWCLGAGFPETINWKESRLMKYWVLDDWG